jgi:hypothetical protein
MEYRTLLLDPTSTTAQRTVFKVDAGLNIMAKKVRVVNFGISNTYGDSVYFNHSGVYSLINKVSINNMQGQEIDRLTNSQYMGIKLLGMPNCAQFALSRQMSQNMCSSIMVDSFSQVSLTEETGKDDASLMGNSLYLDISFMLSYLMSRNVISEGFTLNIEWNDASVLGYQYSFTRPPVLAIDEILVPFTPDPPVSTYLTVVQDMLVMGAGTSSFTKRLNSYYNMYLHSLFYFNVGNQRTNPLSAPLGVAGEKVQLYINSRVLIPLNGIDNYAKKLSYINDLAFPLAICNLPAYTPLASSYDADANLISTRGLYNPNLGIKYDANFSYGCVGIQKYVGQDISIYYEKSEPVGQDSTETVMILAEILRSYDSRTGNVMYAGVPEMPVNAWSS